MTTLYDFKRQLEDANYTAFSCGHNSGAAGGKLEPDVFMQIGDELKAVDVSYSPAHGIILTPSEETCEYTKSIL